MGMERTVLVMPFHFLEYWPYLVEHCDCLDVKDRYLETCVVSNEE